MAIQLIPLIVVVVGGAATVGAGIYAYKNYQDSKEPEAPAAITQQAPEPKIKSEGNNKPEIKPEIKIVETKLPQFDLLRVEEDGSAVIAGSAPADALVEIIHGEKIIASAKAAANGDFAIVLDNPLKPGAYELYLRATDKEGKVVVSAEAGIISVPEPGGELLAMVTKPGAASKLIQVPKIVPVPTPKPAAKEEPEAAAEPAAKVEAKVAPESAPEPAPKSVSEPVAESTPKEIVKADPKTAPQPVVKPVAKAEPKPATEAVAKVEQKSAPEAVAKVEPKPAPEPVAKAETKAAPEPVAKAEPKAAPEVVAKAEPKPAPKPALQPALEPAVEKPVYLGAVEVEGDKIFIAGTGEPGRVINIYVDDKFIGSAMVAPPGSFLLESNSKLSFGNHVVRADMLAKGKAIVVARAEVPLIHDAPEQPKPTIVAKAPESEPEKVAEQAPAKVAEQAPAKVAEQAPAKVAEQAPAKVAEQAPAKVAEQAPAKVEEQAPAKVAEQAPAKVEEQAPAKVAEQAPAKVAEQAPAKVAEQAPAKVAEQVPAKVVKPDPEPVIVAVAPKPKPPKLVAVEKPRRVIRTGSSVIIRRGDNLWRISRRILGRGIRYSTIYQANRDQIRNPNLIFPGQIFAVPEKMIRIDSDKKS